MGLLDNMGFPGGSDGKYSACNAGGPRFDPGVRKIPWRREWLPTPLLLPGDFHGQRRLSGYKPQSHKELDTTERLTLNTMVILLLVSWETSILFSTVAAPIYILTNDVLTWISNSQLKLKTPQLLVWSHLPFQICCDHSLSSLSWCQLFFYLLRPEATFHPFLCLMTYLSSHLQNTSRILLLSISVSRTSLWFLTWIALPNFSLTPWFSSGSF